MRYKRVPQIYLRSALSSYLPSSIDSHILRYIIDLFLFYPSSSPKPRDSNSNSLHGWKVRHSSVPPERTLTQQGHPPSPSASSPSICTYSVSINGATIPETTPYLEFPSTTTQRSYQQVGRACAAHCIGGIELAVLCTTN